MKQEYTIKETIGIVESNMNTLDRNFQNLPPYQSGKKVGGFLSKFIDNIVDGITS